LLINSSQQFSNSTTVTNRWGVYQAGANDVNFLAGITLIGTNVNSNSYQLQVGGNGNISATRIDVNQNVCTYVEATFYKAQGSNDIKFLKSNYSTIQATIFDSDGSLRLGIGTNTGRKLQVEGQAEFITTVGTGTHTTSGNHLPIWVNGIQYWLALLNPPILP
jgi:hypothetical protein